MQQAQFHNLTVEEILKRFKKFRLKDIKFFISRKIIELPPTVDDAARLDAVHKLWRNDTAIKLQLSGKSKRDLSKIVDRAQAGIESKLDSWLYTHIKQQRLAGKPVRTKALIRQVTGIFKLKRDKRTMKQVERSIKNIKRKVTSELKANRDKSK